MAKKRKIRRSLRRRARRAVAKVRTIVRRVTTPMKKRRSRRSSAGGRGLGFGSILPSGMLTTAAVTAGGFIGIGWVFDWITKQFPSLADTSKPWIRIAAKAATAVAGGWALRKVNRTAGNGFGIGGLVAAGLDAWLQFQNDSQAGLAGGVTAAPALTAQKPREIVATQAADPASIAHRQQIEAAEHRTRRAFGLVS